MHCGTKVIFQEAVQKIEITNFPKAENLFILAKRAYDDKLFDEAIKYSAKVLEIDVNNYYAILLNGYAKGMKSTIEKDFLADVTTSVKRVFLEYDAHNKDVSGVEKLTESIVIEIKIIIDSVVARWGDTDWAKFSHFLNNEGFF